MHAEPVLVRQRAAPLFIPLRGAQVRDHDGDLLACTGAVPLATGSDGANIRQLVACTAAATAPGGGSAVVEEGGAACCCPEGARAKLPGEGTGIGTATAGALVAVVVMLQEGIVLVEDGF